MNWFEFFDSLSETEKDKIALLRVVECTNGVIQYAHRDGAPHALPIEQTREAMKYSMGAMKRMTVPLKSGDVTFSEEVETVLRKVRELYISGVKNGNQEDFREFMTVSEATVKVCGLDRLIAARQKVEKEVDNVISEHANWGFQYLIQFLD